MAFQNIVARVLPRQTVPFSRWRYYGFTISGLLLVATILVLATRGLTLGLDFTGGIMVEARSAQPFDPGALRGALAERGMPDAVIQLSDAGRTVLVRLQSDAEGAITLIREALGPDATVLSDTAVGPKVSGDLLRSGIISCLLAVTSIAIYVWLRFETRFGISAFLTTFHDVAMMIGLYAITGMTFDLTSVAAILLIAGYSINDTVIVFDRLRETLGRNRDMPLDEAIDLSITSTLRRTLATSGTTAITSISLMIFGGPVLFGFAVSITVGILLGTLSSIFVASPMLMHLPGPLPGREAEEGRLAA